MADRSPARRGSAVVDAVLGTTVALVARHGYAFSVEDVAERAGVHKTTVYRRWPTKAQLVAEAMDRFAAAEVPEPDADVDPVEGLRRLAHQVAAALRTPAGASALRAVASVVGDDAELVDQAAAFFDRRYGSALGLVGRAAAAGTLRGDVDPALVWGAVVNPMHLRAILGRPVDDDEVDALVDLVLDGARPR